MEEIWDLIDQRWLVFNLALSFMLIAQIILAIKARNRCIRLIKSCKELEYQLERDWERLHNYDIQDRTD